MSCTKSFLIAGYALYLASTNAQVVETTNVTVDNKEIVETEDLSPESNVASVGGTGIVGGIISPQGYLLQRGILQEYEMPQPEIIYDKATKKELGEVVETREFKITAYCPCKICCEKYSYEVTGKKPSTASGTSPKQGRTVAVDTSLIPYGTKLIINGQVYVAEDCGGGIKGWHLDMYFNKHKDAQAWGCKHLEVKILDNAGYKPQESEKDKREKKVKKKLVAIEEEE